MTYGMSKVQNLTQALLFRVLGYNLVLNSNRSINQLLINIIKVNSFYLLKIISIKNKSMFYHLSISRNQLPFVKLLYKVSINKYCLRLSKGSNNVLYRIHINTCLPTNRSIYLRQ